MEKSERIIGVDIAKIVAMVFVVAAHVNGFGLPYAGDSEPSMVYVLMRRFLGVVFGSCIDIFAIASGYVGIVSSFKLSRIVRLWLQVVFTGLAVLVGINIFTDVQVLPIHYIKACVPIAKDEYWYMTAYFMLCFVMPILNVGMKAMDKRSLGGLILLLIGIICGESFLCSVGALGVNGGYSFAWLVVLYVIGAYIRLHNPLDKPKLILLCTALASAMIAGWVPLAFKKLPLPASLPRLFEFGGYTSPFTVIIALCVFAVCLQLRIRSTCLAKLVTLLSSTSLGVYLIHAQPVFLGGIFCSEAKKLTVSGGGGYLLKLITMTVVVYIACSILDYARLMLFKLVENLCVANHAGQGKGSL